MKWYSIKHLAIAARSYRLLLSYQSYAIVIIRKAEPNVDQSRRPGE
jgi:hypothetical protein